MADLNTHRPVSVTVAKEKLQIRTDLSDSDLQEVLGYIDERFESYSKYNLEAGKKFALLALELSQQIVELKRMVHLLKVERDELNSGVKEVTALLDEGLEHSESRNSDWV